MAEDEKSENSISDAPDTPKDLLDKIQSEDTALEIARICIENGINDQEKVKDVGYQTGRVLIGDLPPNKLLKELVDKMKLSVFLASKISREINEEILSPVRESLAAIYGGKVVPSEAPSSDTEEVSMTEKDPRPEKGPDTYREPIE